MAIVKMKRLTLAVVRSQKKELLKELIQHGCVEFSQIDGIIRGSEIEELVKNEGSLLGTYRQQHQSLTHAVEILDRYVPQKTKLLSAKPEKAAQEFLNEKGLDKALKLAGEIEGSDDRIKRISAEESRQRSIAESLKPWLDIDTRLDCEGTKYAALQLATIPATVNLDDVAASILEASEEAEIFEISSDKANRYVALVCLKEDLGAVQEAMRIYGYTPWSAGGLTGTPKQALKEAEKELEKLASEKTKCTEAIVSKADKKDDLKLAADKLSAKVSMSEAEEKLFGTESTVMMEGWLPADEEAEIEKVFAKYDCAYETREPEPDEYPTVPVQLRNNKITSGLNMVTNMYSLPMYGTVDPNPLMAPFFILFYGLMMADIGYGIIMIVAALVALKKIRPREGALSLCRLLLWCGVSTLICGILTGGFFSDIPYQLVHAINPNSTWQGLPHLFSPTEDSNLVLYGAMVLGALHLNTGMVVSFVQKVKAGHLADGLWYEGTLWLILVTAVLALVFHVGFVGNVPVLLLIAVVLMLIGQGRGKKGFGKVTAAFAAIYNEATGWFGDVLSYARIMALMLAGGVVGQVFNTVAIMPMKSSGVNAGTVIAFILIFLFGHAMNFALNILGCYVHDLRLQCLEYFGKFYEAGGKPFSPLKIKGKYINVEE